MGDETDGVVFVNGKPFETRVADDGVRRFRANRIVRDVLRGASEGWTLTPNDIAFGMLLGHYSEDERREVYRLSGHSVCGYREIFPQDEVREAPGGSEHGSV